MSNHILNIEPNIALNASLNLKHLIKRNHILLITVKSGRRSGCCIMINDIKD